MRVICITLILSAIFFSFACNDDTIQIFDPLESCCDNPAITDTIVGYKVTDTETIGPLHVFVPNVFIPNRNGVNDFFTIFSYSDWTKVIELLIVKDEVGNIVFENRHFPPNCDDESWNGEIDGQVVKGIYDYEVTVVSVWDRKKTWTGKVCCLPCDEPENFATKEELLECGKFATQHDGTGMFDASAPVHESLECLE